VIIWIKNKVRETTMTTPKSGRWGRYINNWIATIPAIALVMAVGSAISSAGNLHEAILSNDPASLEALLDGGATVDDSDFLLGTALHRAVVANDFESTKILIAHGADVEAVSEQQGSRPLHLAADANSIEVLMPLVQAGADIEATDGLGQRPLSRAATVGNAEAVELLLFYGAEIDARNGVAHQTSLIEAAYNGHLGSVKILVQRGADINFRDDRGKTALWYAATESGYAPVGGPQLIEFLAEKGANLEAADNTGMTPLAWARANTGRSEIYKIIAEVLIELGALN
jgi:ankyrin repeat protein